jgi:hemerythrin-like metal-binding protein
MTDSSQTTWTDALLTGESVIDDQHRSLFDLLDQLRVAAAEQRTMLAAYAITRLKHYVREHFDTEEAVMRKCHYPKLAEHLAEHEKFRTKLAEFQNKAVVLDISAEMVDFLIDWLVNHVTKSDMRFVPYLKKAQQTV